MKQNLRNSKINFISKILILWVFALINFSFLNLKKEELPSQEETSIPVLFHVMKISKTNFEKYWDRYDPPKFKRFILQFRAIENKDKDDVEYSMKGFVFKLTGTSGSPYEIVNDAALVEDYSPIVLTPGGIETPFALSNIEFRRSDVKDFYDKFKDIAAFDHLKLVPFVDANYYIAVTVTAMDVNDKPLEVTITLSNGEKVTKVIPSAKFNPCPPDKPEG